MLISFMIATGALGFLVKFSIYTQTQATNDVFQFRDGNNAVLWYVPHSCTPIRI